jgi:hypothetical protein
MSQKDKYRRVMAIKRSVKGAIGDDLDHEFRSSHAYQAYTGLCGETFHAYQDGELTDELVEMLDEYAHKVIMLKQNELAQTGRRPKPDNQTGA